MDQLFDILDLQFVDKNIAMTSCDLQALVSLKTIFAEKILAHETVTSCVAVLVTSTAFLGLCAGIFESENIHQSVEMKRCGQVVERISFGYLE